MATIDSRVNRPWQHGEHAFRWPFATHEYRGALSLRSRTALTALRHETHKDGISLVPVRVFIGIGWLRAFAEKAIEIGWRDGTRLAGFLQRQAENGSIVFPPYQALITDVLLPHAVVLGWIVMLGQLLAGVGILTGSLTRAALLGGIFMNLNFLLAGVTDPSAFYIVIQAVLLISGAGGVLGVDVLFAGRGRLLMFGARRPGLRPSPMLPMPAAVALAMLACAVAVCATAHIQDWSPAGSVHDPAAVLAVIAFMVASWFAIGALRGDRLPPTA